jgi:hypothetical protein
VRWIDDVEHPKHKHNSSAVEVRRCFFSSLDTLSEGFQEVMLSLEQGKVSSSFALLFSLTNLMKCTLLLPRS